MTPLARLTAILSRAAGVPDSTALTMGGEVELEFTMGDLRAVYEDALSWVTRLTSDKRLRDRAEAAEQGAKLFALRSETFQRQLEAAEANLARAREILKPFADAANNADDGVPDDLKCEGHYPIHDASWEQVTLDHCRAASRFLTEGATPHTPEQGDGNG